MRTLLLVILFSSIAFAQSSVPTNTSTDVFAMIGSDFVRPGLAPRANLNIGIGHTFAFLKKNPIGDEVTFAYTYENGGTHGFFHSQYGAHTVNVGIMKNFNLLKNIIIKPGKEFDKVTFYTWPMIGNTSITGGDKVMNRLYLGGAVGAAIHLNSHNGIWIQEMLNKVVTMPWYTTTSIGWTYSF